MGRRTSKFCVTVTLTPRTLSELARGPVNTDLSFRTIDADAPLEIIVGDTSDRVTLQTLPSGATFSHGSSYRLIVPSNIRSMLMQTNFREISARVGRLGVVYIRNEPTPPSGGILFGGTYRDGRYKAAAARV